MITEAHVYVCSICGEASTEICVWCTKDTCPNHLCRKCHRCADCCECETPEASGEPPAVCSQLPH